LNREKKKGRKGAPLASRGVLITERHKNKTNHRIIRLEKGKKGVLPRGKKEGNPFPERKNRKRVPRRARKRGHWSQWKQKGRMSGFIIPGKNPPARKKKGGCNALPKKKFG